MVTIWGFCFNVFLLFDSAEFVFSLSAEVFDNAIWLFFPQPEKILA